jgi:hypothetical protein
MILVFLFNRCSSTYYSNYQPDNSNIREWNIEARRSPLPSHNVTIRINDEEVLVAWFSTEPRIFRNVYRGKTVEVFTSYQQDSAIPFKAEILIDGLLVKRLEYAD